MINKKLPCLPTPSFMYSEFRQIKVGKFWQQIRIVKDPSPPLVEWFVYTVPSHSIEDWSEIRKSKLEGQVEIVSDIFYRRGIIGCACQRIWLVAPTRLIHFNIQWSNVRVRNWFISAVNQQIHSPWDDFNSRQIDWKRVIWIHLKRWSVSLEGHCSYDKHCDQRH